MEKIQKAKYDMYSQKREIVSKTRQDLDREVKRKEDAIEEQMREKVMKRESIK